MPPSGSNPNSRKARFVELWKLSSHLADEASTEIMKWVENSFLGDLKSGKGKISFLQSVHWMLHQMLRLRGYKWELRRSGELKIGLWRKSFRTVKKGEKATRIVLIPGFGDSALSWMVVVGGLLPVMKKRCDEFIMLDFPGPTGFLSREKAFHSMDMLMSATFDVLDWLKPTTIIGHSLGGALATHYAGLCGMGERPLDNRKVYSGPETIIVANPSGLPENDQARTEFKGRLREFIDEGFDAWRRYVFQKEPIFLDWIRAEFERFIASEEIIQFVNSLDDKHAVDRALPAIKAKTWVLWGELDRLVPVAGAYAWVKAFNENDGEIHAVILAGASHSLQVENPAVTAAVIGQILRGRTPHSAGRRWWKVVRKDDL